MGEGLLDRDGRLTLMDGTKSSFVKGTRLGISCGRTAKAGDRILFSSSLSVHLIILSTKTTKTMQGLFSVVFWLLVLLQSASCFAFNGVPMMAKVRPCSILPQRQMELCAYRGNAYLSSLEQQTMERAAASVNAVEPNEMKQDSVAREEESLSKTQKLMNQVKDAGTAGIISYALLELGFWLLSVPVVLFGYVQFTGHFPDFSNKDDMSKLGAEALAFVNFARFAVPLRIGLALSTSPWIQENVLDRFFPNETVRYEKTGGPETQLEQSKGPCSNNTLETA